ncbi:hypothetical protein ACWDE0_38555 [Streptomyces sp. 900105755]
MTRDDLGDAFTDRHTEAVEQRLDAKREHREPTRAPAEPTETGGVVDLMVALQESVRKAQAARGEDSRDAGVHEMPESNPKKTAAAKGRRRHAERDPPALCQAAITRGLGRATTALYVLHNR